MYPIAGLCVVMIFIVISHFHDICNDIFTIVVLARFST